jgi:plasmid segregation protein ParM
VEIKHYRVASDNGNSEHAMDIDNELIKQPMVFSIVSEFKKIDRSMDEIVKDIYNFTMGTIASELISGNFACGNYALDSSESVRSTSLQRVPKIESDCVYSNILLRIGAKAFKDLYKNDDYDLDKDATVDITVDMNTSLPAMEHEKHAINFAEKFMKGVHKVTIVLNEYRVTFNIKFTYVYVMPEGVTAMHYLIGSEYEGINFTDVIVQHVGIGGGTTELPQTTGDFFDRNFLRGIPNGTDRAINKGLDKFMECTFNNSMSRQEMGKSVKNKNDDWHTEAIEIIEPHLVVQGEQIVNATFEELSKSHNKAKYILVYGGGSILLKKHILEPFEKRAEQIKSKVIYLESDLAVNIEVYGLKYFLECGYFDSCKSRDLPQ